MTRYRYLAEDGREAFLETPKGHYPPESITAPMPGEAPDVRFIIEREFDNTEIDRRLDLFRVAKDNLEHEEARDIMHSLLVDYVVSLHTPRSLRISRGLGLVEEEEER